MWSSGTHSRRSQGRNIGVWRSKLTKRAAMLIRSLPHLICSFYFKILSIPKPDRLLVDTGAGESCIDSVLAAHLNLPVVDRRDISGVHGRQTVNMHLAQVVVPSLKFTLYGAF